MIGTVLLVRYYTSNRWTEGKTKLDKCATEPRYEPRTSQLPVGCCTYRATPSFPCFAGWVKSDARRPCSRRWRYVSLRFRRRRRRGGDRDRGAAAAPAHRGHPAPGPGGEVRPGDDPADVHALRPRPGTYSLGSLSQDTAIVFLASRRKWAFQTKFSTPFKATLLLVFQYSSML